MNREWIQYININHCGFHVNHESQLFDPLLLRPEPEHRGAE